MVTTSSERSPLRERDKDSRKDDETPPEKSSNSDSAEETLRLERSAAETGQNIHESTSTSAPESTAWQAIFSQQHNAYYFYNAETHQTTWENPLFPTTPCTNSPSSSQTPAVSDATFSISPDEHGTSSYATQHAALQAAALAAGIDPSLAHLDPTLLASIDRASSAAPVGGPPPSFTAKFNARTGQFARPDARDPSHLSEHARATRMSEFYFDVSAWEQQLAAQGGGINNEDDESKKRKRPSKKDLDRFREQKKQKKLAKTAWLRT